MMSNDTIDQLKDGTRAIPPDLSDDDMRQLIIHYATIVRNPKGDRCKEVFAAWASWPKPMFAAFQKMVLDNAYPGQGQSFWAKPADINIKYGIDN
jgi:hypothetical protein